MIWSMRVIAWLLLIIAFCSARDGRAGAGVSVDARVIRVDHVAGKLAITVDKGTEQGVTTGWEAELIDDFDRPVPGTRTRVIRVKSRDCTFAVAGNQLPPGVGRARLHPPPPK
jgi:hypothetical protein